MEKKAYHHGNLEVALIEAGLALVAREGLEAMSLRRVAASCAVSHAAPYKHFSSREDLLTAMQHHVENQFAAALEQALKEEAQESDHMLRLAQAYIRFFMEKPHYFSFFQHQQDGVQVNLSKPEQESNYRPYEVFRRSAFAALQGLLLPEEVQMRVIIAMWAMVHGCTSIAVMNGVVFEGDWPELLGNILRENLGIGGGHFDEAKQAADHT